jgi:membrane-associated phospholipid phosphatase
VIAVQTMGIKIIANDESKTLAVSLFLSILLLIVIHYFAKKSLSDGFHRLSFYFNICAYFFELLVCFALFGLLFVILSYIAAIFSAPYRFYDAELMAIDRGLGFDWLAYIAWVNANPMVNEILKFAYHSVFQIPCLFLGLIFTKNYNRLYSVMLCLIISVITVIALSAIFPSIAPFTYLKINPHDYPNVYMLPAYAHIEDLYRMRFDTEKTIILSALKGIITFPSFHASLSLILAWGFWSIPLLRFPFLLLNLIMFAAIPVSGGHYLTDMLAGAVIATLSIVCVNKLVKYADAKFITV